MKFIAVFAFKPCKILWNMNTYVLRNPKFSIQKIVFKSKRLTVVNFDLCPCSEDTLGKSLRFKAKKRLYHGWIFSKRSQMDPGKT